jgi:hypothetical protein
MSLSAITVYDNGFLPNNAFSRIHGLNFVGAGVTIEVPAIHFIEDVGIATIRVNFSNIPNDVNVSGDVTATAFVGDGSGLTGVVGTGSGVEIQENGSPVGTAATINFGDNLTVDFSGGVATIDAIGAVGGGEESYWTQTLAGIHTLSNVGIGKTNPTEKLDVFGKVKATSFVGNGSELTGVVAIGLTGSPSIGVTSVTAQSIKLPPNFLFDNTSEDKKITFGNNLQLYSVDPSPGSGLKQSRIDVKNAPLYIGSVDKLSESPLIYSFRTSIGIIPNTEANFNQGIFDSRVTLSHNSSVKLTTVGYGVSINGGIAASGIITASSFVGDGSGLTGVVSTSSGVEIQENGSPVGTAATINFGDNLSVDFSGGVATINTISPSGRISIAQTTNNLGIGETANITFSSGLSEYKLLKASASDGAWITIYTDTQSRTDDINRSIDTDPLPGSGVIAELITTGTGITTQRFTPGVVGYNDDEEISNNIYAKVVNNSGISTEITVTLTIAD